MKLRVIVCLCLGWLLWINTATAPAANEPVAFAGFPSHDLEVSPFSDAEVRGLVAHLDTQLANQQDPARWAFDADLYMQTFVDRLQRGVLSRTQEATVLSYLGKLQQRYPSDAANIEKRRLKVDLQTAKIAKPGEPLHISYKTDRPSKIAVFTIVIQGLALSFDMSLKWNVHGVCAMASASAVLVSLGSAAKYLFFVRSVRDGRFPLLA